MPVPTRRLALVAVARSAVVPWCCPVGRWRSGCCRRSTGCCWLVAAGRRGARAVDPRRIGVERDAAAGASRSARPGDGARGRSRNPTGRPVRVALADELAPSLRAGRAGGPRLACPPAARLRGVAPRSARPGGAGSRPPSSCVRVEGPLGLVARQRRRAVPGRCCASTPPFRSRATRPSCASTGPASSRSGCAPPRAAAAAPSSTSCASTPSTTSSAASTGRPPPAPARPIVRTYRAERNQTVIMPARQRPGHGRAGRRRAPGRARHGRGDDAHRGGHPARRPRRPRGVRPRRCAPSSPPGHGRNQLGRVTEAMYQLEPVLAESDYLGAFADDARPVPPPGHARRASPTWSSRRWASRCCPALPLIVPPPRRGRRRACTTPTSCAGRPTPPDGCRRGYRAAAAIAGPRRAPPRRRPACAASAPPSSTRRPAARPPPRRRLPRGQGHRPPLSVAVDGGGTRARSSAGRARRRRR